VALEEVGLQVFTHQNCGNPRFSLTREIRVFSAVPVFDYLACWRET